MLKEKLYCTKSEIVNGKFDNKYIVVTIGNVSENKNQKLLIESMQYIPEDLSNKIVSIIIGGNEKDLVDFVFSKSIRNVYFTGLISQKDVTDILGCVSVCIMTSLNEGFGLPIVEGYEKGVPAIIPKSVDAFEDLFNENICLAFDEYSPRVLADRIVESCQKNWDIEQIKSYSKKFSMDKCAKKYCDFLSEAVKGRGSQLSLEKLEWLFNEAKRI